MSEDQALGLAGPFLILFGIAMMTLCVALVVVMIAAMWKVFTKAGKPGWAALIPIYNMIVLLEIAGRPGWWVLLYFIPLANIIFSIIAHIDLARSFGKGTGFGVGLALLGWIFYPILGFGDARYGGPAAGAGTSPGPRLAPQV